MDSTPDIADLSMLFRAEASPAERARTIRAFGTAARIRLQAAATAVGHGRDALAERGAQLLSEVAPRLPIRTAETLRRQYGEDPETQSQQVIAEAVKLARWLWTAAAMVPGPPPMVHAIKVILHSAIEIRMTGELYEIHSDADRDETWLGAVLLSWAGGQPVIPGIHADVSAAAINKIRRSIAELASNESRLVTLASRGRAGANMVQRSGARMQRRMRPHPSMWTQPSGRSFGAVVREAVAEAASEKLAGRIPPALVSVARDRLTPAMSTADTSPAAVATSNPRQALAQGWVLHQQAAAAIAGLSTLEPVIGRLVMALTHQERQLQGLGQQLGQAGSAVPSQRDGRDLSEAGQLFGWAQDAIDLVEDIGARPRRLPSWSTRRRAALVYLVTALVVAAVPAVAIANSSGLAELGLVLAQCLALPWLSLVAGAIAIGPLFRPWLGGPVARHPVIGTWIVIGVHTVLGLSAAVFGALA